MCARLSSTLHPVSYTPSDGGSNTKNQTCGADVQGYYPLATPSTEILFWKISLLI